MSLKYVTPILFRQGRCRAFRSLLPKEVLASERHKDLPLINIFGLPPCRNFIQTSTLMSSTKKEYTGKKLVGYSMESMFDVVSDVDNYKNFLPFCKQSTVLSRSTNKLVADLAIGFPPIREEYTSHVTLLRPHLVKAVGTECRIIKHLVTVWKFSPGLKNSSNTCIIDFFVSFEFRSSLHSQVAHFFFNELVRQMEGAFYQEAKARYGRPTIPTRILAVPQGSTKS